ncbi:MAG: hypothetical protein ACJAS3_002221 [Roseivirga sp.]|jgi:hypothetical protein
MRNSASIFIVLLIVSSCYSGDPDVVRLSSERMKNFTISEESKIKVSESEKIYIDPTTVKLEIAKASDLFKNREYINLQTPDGIIVGQISKMKINNGRILILDALISKNAYLFDEDGKYIFTIGKKGGGPGEIDDPVDIELTDKKIYVIDRQFAVHEYDYQNEFIQMQKIPFFSHSVFAFNNETLAFSNNTTGFDDLSYQILFINEQNITQGALKNKGTAISQYTSQHLSYNKKVHGNSFLFSEPWGNIVYQMYSDKIEAKYEIVSKTPFPESLLNNPSQLSLDEFKYTFIYDWPILETNELIMLRAASNQKLMTIFYNLKLQTLKSYGAIEDDLLYGGISDFPFYVNDKSFYLPLNVEQLYAVKEEIEQIEDDQLLAELEQARPEVFMLLKNITELSNPILMKCDIY